MIRFVREQFDGKYEEVTEEEKQQNKYTHIIISKGRYKALKKQMLEEVHMQVRLQEDNLNRSLLRIMRERANASRKLSPKKEHSGYVILMMQQIDWSYKKGHGETVNATIWRSSVQTPYSASLPYKSISEYIREDLEKGGVLSGFGCDYVVDSADRGICLDAIEEHSTNNVLVKCLYRANFKSTFWEIDLFTSKPLRINDNEIP